MKIYQVEDDENNVYSPKGDYSFIAFKSKKEATDYKNYLKDNFEIYAKVYEYNVIDIEEPTII